MPSNFFQRAFTRLLLMSRRQSGPMTRVAILATINAQLAITSISKLCSPFALERWACDA